MRRCIVRFKGDLTLEQRMQLALQAGLESADHFTLSHRPLIVYYIADATHETEALRWQPFENAITSIRVEKE